MTKTKVFNFCEKKFENHQFEVATYKDSSIQETTTNPCHKEEELFTYPLHGILQNCNTPTFPP